MIIYVNIRGTNPIDMPLYMRSVYCWPQQWFNLFPWSVACVVSSIFHALILWRMKNIFLFKQWKILKKILRDNVGRPCTLMSSPTCRVVSSNLFVFFLLHFQRLSSAYRNFLITMTIMRQNFLVFEFSQYEKKNINTSNLIYFDFRSINSKFNSHFYSFLHLSSQLHSLSSLFLFFRLYYHFRTKQYQPTIPKS